MTLWNHLPFNDPRVLGHKSFDSIGTWPSACDHNRAVSNLDLDNVEHVDILYFCTYDTSVQVNAMSVNCSCFHLNRWKKSWSYLNCTMQGGIVLWAKSLQPPRLSHLPNFQWYNALHGDFVTYSPAPLYRANFVHPPCKVLHRYLKIVSFALFLIMNVDIWILFNHTH